MKRGILFSFVLFIASDSFAYCHEPPDRPPFCAQQLYADRFKDDLEYSMCKIDMKRYGSELDTWVECVNTEATNRMEKAVRVFNCKVKGENFCP